MEYNLVMDKQRKINYYSIAIISLIYLIMASLPFSRYIKNEYIAYGFEMLMRVSFIPVYIIYSRKNKLTFPRFLTNVLPFGVLPLFLISFSNLITGTMLGYERSVFDSKDVIMNLFRYLMVGINEEILFRGLLVEELRKYSSKRNVILISSLCFGLIHLVNISGFGAIPAVLMQVGYSFVTGLILSTCYLYGKSIIYPIILHFSFDFINDTIATNVFILNWDIGYFIVNILVGIIVLAYAFLLYRKIKEDNNVSENLDN